MAASPARDVDQLLETVIFAEMSRRGYKVTIGRVKEKVVDFVCERDGDRLYIQVAYLMPTEETREREFSALRARGLVKGRSVLNSNFVKFPRSRV